MLDIGYQNWTPCAGDFIFGPMLLCSALDRQKFTYYAKCKPNETIYIIYTVGYNAVSKNKQTINQSVLPYYRLF